MHAKLILVGGYVYAIHSQYADTSIAWWHSQVLFIIIMEEGCLHIQGWRISSTLKAGWLCSYDMFIPAYQTTRCHIVEHQSVHFHCSEMLHVK
jgi:hypothetical protein